GRERMRNLSVRIARETMQQHRQDVRSIYRSRKHGKRWPWKKINYAEAIRKVIGKPPAAGSHFRNPGRNGACGRSDLVEPTSQRRNWATKQATSCSKPVMIFVE